MSKENIKQAYESLADSYNALIDHKPHNAYYDRPNTLALIGEVNGMDVLDAACGPGKYAEVLMADGARVTGFDISTQMIKNAKERNPDQGSFFVHDLNEPFSLLKDNSFDIVVCALAMHYLPDWSPALQEFHRVLRPHGKLIISIEHPIFDFNYHKSSKYFEIEPVNCVWNGFGTPVEIHSYRRPLFACINPLLENGFYLDKLVEPLPVPEFEQLDPKHFRELNEFPAFMCIRAVKR